MNITITPGKLSGTVEAIPSKSMAHRMLICAAFCDRETELICPETSRDIQATLDCLKALGASILPTASGYQVIPINIVPQEASLHCGESGSTLRFLLPIVGALGVKATFHMEGRLPLRPLSPLWEELERMGCTLSRPTETTLLCTGKLRPGDYSIDGSVSSQFITGLLFGLALIEGETSLTVTGKAESRPYIDMTRQVLAQFDAPNFHSPGSVTVEGDWSNAAFWLAAKILGSDLTVTNLNPNSVQGDRAIEYLLSDLAENPIIDASDIPDLVPILAVVRACFRGVTFSGIRRLRLKESDRVESTIAMLKALGGHAEATEDTLTVYPTGLTGGTVNAGNDHRIAMSAAIASTACHQKVTILGAECVNKSYPRFWEDFSRLGGKYELDLR